MPYTELAFAGQSLLGSALIYLLMYQKLATSNTVNRATFNTPIMPFAMMTRIRAVNIKCHKQLSFT